MRNCICSRIWSSRMQTAFAAITYYTNCVFSLVKSILANRDQYRPISSLSEVGTDLLRICQLWSTRTLANQLLQMLSMLTSRVHCSARTSTIWNICGILAVVGLVVFTHTHTRAQLAPRIESFTAAASYEDTPSDKDKASSYEDTPSDKDTPSGKDTSS